MPRNPLLKSQTGLRAEDLALLQVVNQQRRLIGSHAVVDDGSQKTHSIFPNVPLLVKTIAETCLEAKGGGGGVGCMNPITPCNRGRFSRYACVRRRICSCDQFKKTTVSFSLYYSSLY